jgi:hypothetical protein
MHTTACCNTAFRDGSGACESFDKFVDEDRITLGFRHLDVVLAVGTGGSGPNRFSAGLAIPDIGRPEFALQRLGEGPLQAVDKSAENGLLAPTIENSAEPVIRNLLTALVAVKSLDPRATNFYADAMYLAVFARPPCLRSDAQQSAPRAGGHGSAGRRIGALQKCRLKRAVDYLDNLANKIKLAACRMPSKQLPSHFDMIAGFPRMTVRVEPIATAMRQTTRGWSREVQAETAGPTMASLTL